MTRSIFLFLGTFVAGALVALLVRGAMFKPHIGQESPPAGGDYAPMVSNSLTPAKAGETQNNEAATFGAPANHSVAVAATAGAKPVNTVCAICGMDVDPKIPTAEYHGKTIGFGCKMCPPKFKAEPDRYGPLYLKNEVIKR